MKSEKSLVGRVLILLAFVAGYWLFAGGIDSHFWPPFVFVLVVTMGWGNAHIGGEKKDTNKS